MEQIIRPQNDILKILGKAVGPGTACRWLKYCLPVQTESGMLVLNLLTRELLHLTWAEYAAYRDSEYLRSHWFVVEEAADDRELVELVRWVRSRVSKKKTQITKYTILTTTDCNARCFYCYEQGCRKVTMRDDTADKTVAFIKACCGGKKVHINWFGGEPLMNPSVISRICGGLRSEGIEFESSMVSNAYLLDEKTVTEAAEVCNLKRIQITLDGTEKVYNRSKNYVNATESAYQVVTGNIHRALKAGIQVTIRLNMDLHNMEDLMTLADELAARFSGERKLKVYAHLLFESEGTGENRKSREEQELLHHGLNRLEDKLTGHGLFSGAGRGLTRHLPMHHCMADSSNAVIILPDGHLGLCEHHTEDEFIGHIDAPERDKAVIALWRERSEEIPECRDCFCYPACIKLKKCPSEGQCTEFERLRIRRKTERAMGNEYRYWTSRRECGGDEAPEQEMC